jgi:hypothetical protein
MKNTQHLSNQSPKQEKNSKVTQIPEEIYIVQVSYLPEKMRQNIIYISIWDLQENGLVTISCLAILIRIAAHNDCVVRGSGIRGFS